MPGTNHVDGQQRAARIGRAVEDAWRRRFASEDAAEEAVLREHPDLLPELSDEIRAVELVARARRLANVNGSRRARQASVHVTSAPARGETWTLGRYRVLRLLGVGGMGAVYEAEQDRPRRTVALKVVRAGHVSPAALRRFELEAEALGRLQHPAIAQIYEAGAAPMPHGPQPYFAMELVRGGRSILDYANAHGLDLRQRVALLAESAEAVHYAHQQGVIHRDIKPDNILVDTSGQVKVLDFGVARIANLAATDLTLTRPGQVVGTLAYMSPEQAAGADGVDTRSDVYSLGVLAYELLAGRLPYELLSQFAIARALQVIQEHEAPLLGDINPRCRGSLEAIVAEALAKDKQRRYASASEFAADLRRFLAGEPVLVSPPRLWHHLQRLARKHQRTAIGVAAKALMTLISGLGGGVGWLRARHAQRLAERRRREAEAAVAALQRQVEAHEATAYLHRIALADQALTDGDVSTARGLLQQCPEPRRGWEWQWLWRQTDRSERTITPPRRVYGLTWSPDGARLAVGMEGGEVAVFDALSGETVLRFNAHGGESVRYKAVYRVRFSPNGRLLATSGGDGCVCLWDAATGRHIALRRAGQPFIRLLEFSPSGEQLLFVPHFRGPGTTPPGWDGTGRELHLWNLGSGEVRTLLLPSPDNVRGVAWIPDGARIVALEASGLAHVFEVADHGSAPAGAAIHLKGGNGITISPDGRTAVVTGCGDRVMVYDVASGHLVHELLGHRSHTTASAFHRAGRFLATASTDNTVVLWDWDWGKQVLGLRGHTAGVPDLAWSPDGQWLATANETNLKLWRPLDLFDDHLPVAAACPHENLWGLGVTRSGDRAIYWVPGRIALADPHLGWQVLADAAWPKFGQIGPRASLWGLSEDAAVVAVATPDSDGVIHVWEPTSGDRWTAREDGQPPDQCVAVSSDGRWIYAAGADYRIRRWEVATRRAVGDVVVPRADGDAGESVRALACSPDGRRLAFADTLQLSLLDASSGELLWRLPLTGQPEVTHLVFSPDGGRLVALLDHETIHLVAVETGSRQVLPTEGHGHAAVRLLVVNWSPDGDRLVTGDTSAALKIWDVQAGLPVLSLRGHEHAVTGVAWMPNGRIASCSLDQTIRVW